MTVTVRETSRRCDRCRRVTPSVRQVTVRWDGRSQAQQCLCRRCRGELVDTLGRYMTDGQDG